MAEPQPQGTPSEEDRKKAFIFVGAATPELKKQIDEASKKAGFDEVAFVDVPTIIFDDPKVKTAFEAQEEVCNVYLQWIPKFQTLFAKCVTGLKWTDKTDWEIKTIHYLCDRIFHGCVHALSLNMEDPCYSYVDCASLNRSLFESAVNCLNLRKDKGKRAFAEFISRSIDDDIKRRDELSKWISHKVPAIAEGALQQIQFIKSEQRNKQTLLDEIGFKGNPPGLADIRSRCEKLGDVWKFLYVSRYMELCGWSHIHLEHVAYSPSHSRSSAEDLAHAIGKGTEMVYLGFNLAYQFLNSLTEGDEPTEKEIYNLYMELIDKLNPIFAKAGNFTPPGRAA